MKISRTTVSLLLLITSKCCAVNPLNFFQNLSVFSQLGGNLFDFDVNINRFSEDISQVYKQKYDFVVVGSGPAGSVIANRLSENPEWNVLLLEVGEVPTKLVNVPAFMNFFQFTDYNWHYLMEEQENMCLGLTDKRMHWPRGKVLGGTSVINFLIHIRGNRFDYDRWAEKGNKGWSYDELLPYFKKSEDFLVKIQDPGYHQKGGYLGVQDIDRRSGSAKAFVDAMQEYGYKYVDYNGKEQIGVSYVHGTLRNGRRASAYNAFLVPVAHRKNLKIYTGARVTKILIDEKTRTAYGVLFVKEKRKYFVRANKEVIISAGALNSPQLLMLSGVGPKEHLDELGIPVIQNLPVGQKLYDHLAFFGLLYKVNVTLTLHYDDFYDISSFTDFLLRGTGILATLSGVEALGIVKTKLADPASDYPDIELILVGGGLHTDRGEVYRKTFRVSDRVYDAIYKPLEGKEAFSICPMLYHPRSYGYIKLKSSNPYHWPKFCGNYFTDPDNFDVKTFIAAIRLIQDIIKMPSFQKYDAKIVDVPVPGCEHHQFDTDEYWECALRHIAVTLHHQVATCRMGPSNDPEAVVDDQLRVYGVKNLRVADTSIIPEPVSAHTNVPSFMIGEKAADMIKKAWERR